MDAQVSLCLLNKFKSQVILIKRKVSECLIIETEAQFAKTLRQNIYFWHSYRSEFKQQFPFLLFSAPE